MQVINIDALTPLLDYQEGVRAFLDGMRSTAPAPDFDAVMVPGDFERRSRRQRLAHGIEVPRTVSDQIRDWADRLDVSLPDAEAEATEIRHYRSTN